MVRNVDFETRRRAILAATINRYIHNAMPVASEDIAEEFGLSSATIRNIFSELEKEGYLKQPHTSGGRVPTDKSYRYYVDFLVLQMALLENQRKDILKQYKKKIRRLEDTLEETSEIISKITHYTGIVSFLEWHDKFFYAGISNILENPEFRSFDKIRILIKAIEDKGNILKIINQDFEERVKVYIGNELGCPQMQDCSLVVSSYKIKDRPCGRVAVLGPMRMEYRSIIPTMESLSCVLTEILESVEQI